MDVALALLPLTESTPATGCKVFCESCSVNRRSCGSSVGEALVVYFVLQLLREQYCDCIANRKILDSYVYHSAITKLVLRREEGYCYARLERLGIVEFCDDLADYFIRMLSGIVNFEGIEKVVSVYTVEQRIVKSY